MSLVPFSGHRPTSFHPDTLRTVQTLGRIARKLYDNWSSSSSSTPTLMPNQSRGKGGSRRSGNSSMAPQNRSDLRVVPPSRSTPFFVPKQVSNQIVWDLLKTDVAITVNAITVTENNFSAQLSLHPQVASWTALFDQWCVPQFSVTFRAQEAPGGTGSVPLLYTALDFDNGTAIGTVPIIEDFATCQVNIMTTGSTVTRSIKPCVKGTVQNQSGSANSGIERRWIDSAAPNTQHFGIRSIVGPGNSNNIVATMCIWFAFRNQI